MKVTITEDEIKNAILDRLTSQGIVTQGREVSMAFTKGRANNGGLQVTVELIDPNLKSISTGTAEEVEPEEDKPVPVEPVVSTGGGLLSRVKPVNKFVSAAPKDEPVTTVGADAPVELPSDDEPAFDADPPATENESAAPAQTQSLFRR